MKSKYSVQEKLKWMKLLEPVRTSQVLYGVNIYHKKKFFLDFSILYCNFVTQNTDYYVRKTN